MSKEKTFIPLLAPNDEINLNEIPYPVLASKKLDGCRLVSYRGQLLTRSLKSLQNKQLNEKFEFLRKYSENNMLPDGEIYAHGIPFQFIVSCFMTQDFTTKSAIKRWENLCEEHDFHMSREEVFNRLKFNCFDMVKDEDFNLAFVHRLQLAEESCMNFNKDLITFIEHKLLNNSQEVEKYFQEVLNEGYEGLILRNPDGRYKFDRATIKQNILFKYKPFVTTDSVIIGIVQATEVNKDAEKTKNEYGRSVTSKKAKDRHLIEKASNFIVDFEGKDLKVPLGKNSDKKKRYIWNHQEEYIGKYVEYKYMKVGMKKDGLPRIPKFVRMRPDKD